MKNWRVAVVWVAGLLLIAVTARLGFWQLDRAAQKTALHEAVLKQKDSPVPGYIEFVASRLNGGDSSWAKDLHRPIEVRGRWMPSHTVFLDNRQMNGRPGFYVLTPLVLDGVKTADGKNMVWMVQRGWVPRDFLQRERLPRVPTPSDSVTVIARIAAAPARLFELGGRNQNPADAGLSAIRQNLDLPAFARELETQSPMRVQLIEASSLVQLKAEATLENMAGSVPTTSGQQSDGLLRQWPEPQLGAAKNHGYAAQWFGLCGLTVLLLLWFQVIAPRRQRQDGNVNN